MENKTDQNKVIDSLTKNWIKFLVYCFLILFSFNYITDQLRYDTIFPVNYFQSQQYSQQIINFLEAFYQENIELPQLQIPLEEIEVTKQEILDAKYNSSYEYDRYLYNNSEIASIKSLTDEQIKDIIQYAKYEENQNQIETYKHNYYEDKNAFYYDLKDSNGKTYNNVPSESEDYLNIISIPYKGKNATDFSNLNNVARNYGISGTLYLPKYAMGESTIQSSFFANMTTKIMWIGAIIIFIASLLPLYQSFKKIKDTQIKIPDQYKWIEDKYLTLPIEFKALIFLGTIFFLKDINTRIHYWYYNNLVVYIINLVIQITITIIMIYFFFLQLQGVIYRIKYPNVLKQEWNKGFYMSNIDDWNKLPIYRSLFIRVTLYSAIIGLWGIIWGISLSDYTGLLFSLISIVLGLILLAIIKKQTKKTQAICNALSKMANNEVASEINVKGHGIISNMAKDINAIREELAISSQKQSNSERLKTELITNVSHDLRTPLTSVLNYVDLAKRTDITDEERQEYLQIIDNKSKRLKILIDDLFEASKMASGAVELNKEQVDLVSLMYQALAEYDDRFEEQKLTIRTKTSAQHMYAYCDGRKMYRVFENLFSNVIKYAQPATRVYLEMIYEGSEIVVILKNISNYELGFDVKELAERFKRGDSSRHTEGSGLGLSIVKSILDLHGAALELSQDGDLFKITFRISKL